jgi:uncharacterized protein with HEPN domain
MKRTVKDFLNDILSTIDSINRFIDGLTFDSFCEDEKKIRDILSHKCFGIELRIIWDTIQNDLPLLSSCLSHSKACIFPNKRWF